ncbi:hypothetical protein J6590_105826, partial [Homalodisca vitripennis]
DAWSSLRFSYCTTPVSDDESHHYIFVATTLIFCSCSSLEMALLTARNCSAPLTFVLQEDCGQ